MTTNVNANSCSEKPNRSDTIYRQDAINEFEEWITSGEANTRVDANARMYKRLKNLPSAQQEHKIEFVKLIVRDINGKSYYSIIYLENGDEFEGYSSYSLDVISDYLKRYFSFAQPEQIKKESPLINIKPKEIPTIKHTYKYRTAKLNNQTHLCDSCKYTYLDCPSKSKDVIIKNREGNDNICACNKYKPSSQLSDEYEQGWKDGRKALQEEIWGRNRLKLEVNKIGKFVPEFDFDDDEPERQEGEWVLKEKLVPLPLDCSPLNYDKYDKETHSEWQSSFYFCSKCGWESGEFKGGNYCPKCGARMKGEYYG